MSEHTAPVNSAKLLLPVVILGMLLLMTIMYFAGGNAFVTEYHDQGVVHSTSGGH